jgi:hypothetical protein
LDQISYKYKEFFFSSPLVFIKFLSISQKKKNTIYGKQCDTSCGFAKEKNQEKRKMSG